MSLNELILPSAIIASARPAGKKQLLSDVANHLGKIVDIPERSIFESLLQREKLGSTGIGNGIAIPHAKFEGLGKLAGLFVRLEKPIDFDALDGAPVDLIFVLLAPDGAGAEHLKGLARIARLFRDPQRAAKLRATKDPDVLYSLLCEQASAPVAA